jgi:hypothetical protein
LPTFASDRDKFKSARHTNTSLQLSLNPTPSGSPLTRPVNLTLSRETSPVGANRSPLAGSGFSPESLSRRLRDHDSAAGPADQADCPFAAQSSEVGLGLRYQPQPLYQPTPPPPIPQPHIGRSALSHEITLSSGEPSPGEEVVSFLSRSNSESYAGSAERGIGRRRGRVRVPTAVQAQAPRMSRANSAGNLPTSERREESQGGKDGMDVVERTKEEEENEARSSSPASPPPPPLPQQPQPTTATTATRPKRSGSTGSMLWRELAVRFLSFCSIRPAIPTLALPRQLVIVVS